jgi:ornithine carbamoyltransferase
MMGVQVRIGAPRGYQLADTAVQQAAARARNGATVQVLEDPHAAVRDADAVYTDVWASMGEEHEAEERKRVFAPYQVNTALMASAGPKALFMHCLPAHRGEEVTADVIDGPQSVVWDEAENRLHVQKALMEYLVLGKVED